MPSHKSSAFLIQNVFDQTGFYRVITSFVLSAGGAKRGDIFILCFLVWASGFRGLAQGDLQALKTRRRFSRIGVCDFGSRRLAGVIPRREDGANHRNTLFAGLPRSPKLQGVPSKAKASANASPGRQNDRNPVP